MYRIVANITPSQNAKNGATLSNVERELRFSLGYFFMKGWNSAGFGGIKGSIDLLVENGVNEEDAKKMAINKFVDGIPYTTDDIEEIHKMFWNRKREIEG